jgi:hypothetical protein
MATIDHITEGSTLPDYGGSRHTGSSSSFKQALQDTTDDVSHRGYDDPSMTGTWNGPTDTKNTRLYINNPEVQQLRSVVSGSNKNAGDWRRRMSMASYNGDRRVTRQERYEDKQPVGCNGPVICKLGLMMKDIIVAHNNNLPILAAKSDVFAPGGVSAPRQNGDVSLVSAGFAVPTDSANGGSSLNNAVGLNYAINIGPGSAVTDMQQKNFVGGISNGTGGF